jgi:hypothetical protein
MPGPAARGPEETKMLLEFMHEGGVLMWPLLILGVLTIVAATRRALGHEGVLNADKLARSVLAASLAWSAVGMRYAINAQYTDLQDYCGELRIRLLGLGEALAPAVLGLVVLAIVAAISSLPRGRAVSS